MAPAGASAAAEEKAKRVRDLLSSYYGSTGADEGDNGSVRDESPGRGRLGPQNRRAVPPAAPRVAGLDSTDFDVDRCASGRIAGSSHLEEGVLNAKDGSSCHMKNKYV